MVCIWNILFVSLFLIRSSCSSPQSSAVPAKRYTVNLDLDPRLRWTEIVQEHEKELYDLLQGVKKVVPREALAVLSIIGKNVDKYVPYPYNVEIVGIAASIKGVSPGDVLLGNTLYELTAYGSKRSKACTSIVAEYINGTIYHGRNLDYGFSDVLRNLTIIVDFQKGGQTVYTGTTYIGYVGLLTGQKPNGYTITLDERDQGKWWMNALQALITGTHGIAAFRVRDALANEDMDFESAVIYLADKPLIAPSYIIIGGTKPREGVVITRGRIAAVDLWRLDAEQGRWYLVETNYDHWLPPPSNDDRRDPAIRAMNTTTRAGLSPDSLFKVMSTPPVLNDGTTYTVIMSAAIPELYNTWVRYP